MKSSGPDEIDKDVADANPYRDADGQFDGAAEALSYRDAENDDGGDRGEEWLRMPNDVVCDEPGDRCGQPALSDG